MRSSRLLSSALLWFCSLAALAQGTIPVPVANTASRPVSIAVDLSKSMGPYKPVYNWFGYDEGNYTTGHDGRKLLHELHDLSPVPV